MGDAGRDHDPVVLAELAGLDDRRAARAAEEGPQVDQRDERPARGDDPVVELAPVVVQAAQDAGRGGGQVRLDERRRGRAGPRPRRPARSPNGVGAPQLAERAARVGRPGDRAVADAGQRPTAVARGSSRARRLPPRPLERGGVVGHRVGPRPERLAGRERGRREDAPARRDRRPRPGARRGRARRVTARPNRPTMYSAHRARVASSPLTTWWMPACASSASSSTIASATSCV